MNFFSGARCFFVADAIIKTKPANLHQYEKLVIYITLVLNLSYCIVGATPCGCPSPRILCTTERRAGTQARPYAICTLYLETVLCDFYRYFSSRHKSSLPRLRIKFIDCVL